MATETKREFRESIDTSLLIFAFILGVGSALVLKIMGLPAWMPSLVAGAVIIAYAVATYFSSSARLEPEQIGDNCYYLGFCITLASLAYTLYALGTAGEDAAILSDVIAGFGVALSSTVVGVMARVVLLQFRVDLAARDKEVRSQLNQVMRSFHGEMQSSVTSTRETITQIRQTLDEHTHETIEHNKRMQESFEGRIAALVEEAVTGVKAAMIEVVDNDKDMNRRLSASSRANMATAEKAIQDSMEAITENLNRAMTRLEEGMQHANTSSITTLERVVTEVSATMRLLSEEAAKSIEAARQAQSSEMTKAVEAVASNIFQIAGQIGAQKDTLREALDGFTQQAETARREAGALVKESAASREDTRKSAEVVEAAASRIAGSVERAEEAFSQSAAQAAMQLSEQAAKSIDAARQAQSSEMTKAVEAVASNIFQIADQIGAEKDTLREALDGFAQQAEASRREVGALVKESAASREDTRKSAEVVEAAASRIASSVERAEEAFSRSATQAAMQLSEQAAKPIEAARQAQSSEMTRAVEAENTDTDSAENGAAPQTSPTGPAGEPAGQPVPPGTYDAEPGRPSAWGSWFRQRK